MAKISLNEMKRGVLAAIELHGKDTVYSRGELGLETCEYKPNANNPNHGCLIGEALKIIRPKFYASIPPRLSDDAEGLLFNDGFGPASHIAAQYAFLVQRAQDAGDTWGEASISALRQMEGK